MTATASASDKVLDILEEERAEKESFRYERDEAVKARDAAVRLLAALEEGIAAAPSDLYEIRRGILIEYEESGKHSPVVVGYGPLTVDRRHLAYCLQRELIPYDGSGDLTAALNDELVFELGLSGVRRAYAVMLPAECASFKVWWAGQKAPKGAR